MLCAISGEAPQLPVASRKSGNVFEKRLIEDYIAANGTDPVTGEELTTDDLVELKTARVVKPRPPSLTSIPSLLTAFQNEWDAVALETYTLKQQLAQTRQELSTALYQHDAAKRVIARLVRERDEARDALSKITVSGGGAANGDAMQLDGQSVPAAIAEKVDATQQKLSSTRRKRRVPEDWASPEDIQTFDAESTSDPLYPGSSSLALDNTGELVLFGGTDGVAGVYSIARKEVVQTIKAGSGAITDVLWWDEKQVIATATGAIKVFKDETGLGSFRSHAGAATGVALHPSGEILASVGVDKSYVLYDLTEMQPIARTYSDSELTCCTFHPDGHFFAAGGKNGQVRLFNVNSGDVAATFDAEAPVQSLSFSENGTWLASAAKGQSTVTVWDLRKMEVIKSLDVGNAVEKVTWDYTGQYLAAASRGCVVVQHYEKKGKKWSEPFRKAVAAVDVAWGQDARSLACVTPEGAISVFGSS